MRPASRWHVRPAHVPSTPQTHGRMITSQAKRPQILCASKTSQPSILSLKTRSLAVRKGGLLRDFRLTAVRHVERFKPTEAPTNTTSARRTELAFAYHTCLDFGSFDLGFQPWSGRNPPLENHAWTVFARMVLIRRTSNSCEKPFELPQKLSASKFHARVETFNSPRPPRELCDLCDKNCARNKLHSWKLLLTSNRVQAPSS